MILIPEQIKNLIEQRNNLKLEMEKKNAYFDSLDIIDLGTTHTIKPTDSFADTSFQITKRKLEEIETAFSNSTYLKERTIHKIDIGTRFLFQFFEEGDICDFILVDHSIGSSSVDGFISKDSVIGKKVLGKKERMEIDGVGVILEIKKDWQDYVHFLTDRTYSHRRSTIDRKESLMEKRTEREKYITESQKELLEFERQRLLLNPSSSYSVLRLRKINQILRNSKLADLPCDHTIGIGSQFSLMTFNEKKTNIRRVEMIDYAVSNELSDYYVEKIDPIGSRVLGLHEGEDFCYYSKDGYVSGVVFDIDNSKDRIETFNPLTYQKLRRNHK